MSLTPAVLPQPGKVTVRGTFADKMQNRRTAHRERPRRFHSFRRSREIVRIGYSFGRSNRDGKMQNPLTASIQATQRFHSFGRSRKNIRTSYSLGRSKRYGKMQSPLTASIQATRRFHSFGRSRENIRTGYSLGRSKRYRGKMQNLLTAHIETPLRKRIAKKHCRFLKDMI